MSAVNAFMIILMLLLLVYTFYRLFKKKSLLMLIPACAQIFILAIAILSFINRVEVPQFIEIAYVLLGILPPMVFLIIDYSRMVRKVKSQGVYDGLVEQNPKPVTFELCLPSEGINQIAKEKQIPDILKELKILPDEMQKNFRKCLNHAHLFLSEKDYTGAFHIYDTLSKAAGSSCMLYYNLAGICYRLEKYEEALEYYKKVLELNNAPAADQQDISYNMGNTYYMLKKYGKAARSYEKTLEANPENTQAVENLAFTYVRMGEQEKGIELLNKISVKEGHFRAHFISDKLLHEAGKYNEAEQELMKSIKLQPDSIEALDELGRVLLMLKKPEAALDIYERITHLNQDDYSAWCSKANIYSKLNRWKEAASNYKEAVRIRPDNYRSHYNLAVALDECGSRQAAAEAFKEAIILHPDFVDAYNNLGITLSLLGRYEEALEVYEEGIKRNPQNFSLFFNMGMNLFETGKYVEAAAAYRNAIDIKPDELEIYYYLGAALTELRHYNDAIDAYKCALKIKPADGELHYNIAAIYAMLGRYDIAVENLKQAIELNGDIRSDARQNRAFDGMRSRSEYKEMMSLG